MGAHGALRAAGEDPMPRHMPTVRIFAATHESQRYDTCGDWYYEGATVDHKDLVVVVSHMDDWRSEAAIAIHELCEAAICRHQGVSGESVDHFDRLAAEWIAKRFDGPRPTFLKDAADPIRSAEIIVFGPDKKPYELAADYDPGDLANAPYYFAHQTATIIERIFCFAVQLDWIEHNERLNALSR